MRRLYSAPATRLAALALAATLAGSPASGRAQESGVCGGATTIVVETTAPPARSGGPFDIQLQFDAVLEGQAAEPFTITGGSNDKLRMQVNGGSAFTVTLPDSANLDAQQLANILNADPGFAAVADAWQSARAGSSNGQGTLLLRSRGATNGSIRLLSVADDAYTMLGLGIYVDSTVTSSVLPGEQAVLEQAALDWETIFTGAGTSANPYTMRAAYFEFLPGTTVLANATVIENGAGALLSGRSQFNRDRTWYVDPDPSTDGEFLPDGTGGPPGTDLLTVARHEFGHALGISSGGSRYFQNLSADSATFDPGRLNIGTVVGGAHVDPAVHANDLMVPATGASLRRAASLYPDASMLSRMHFYTVPMAYVDSNTAGPDGTVNKPWPTPDDLQTNEPADKPALVVPRQYPGTYLLTEAREWKAARGGSAEIGAP